MINLNKPLTVEFWPLRWVFYPAGGIEIETFNPAGEGQWYIAVEASEDARGGLTFTDSILMR